MSTSTCGSRSTLLTIASSQARNISGYFSGLVLALGDRADHRAHVLADAELGRADEVADVLDDQQVDLIQRQRAERRAHHVRVEVTLAAEALAGVELDDRHVQRGQALGVERALDVALEHAPRARSPVSASTRSSSAVLPAPGALIRLTTVTPARSKSARLARAIVLLASSASSTTLTLTLCMATST